MDMVDNNQNKQRPGFSRKLGVNEKVEVTPIFFFPFSCCCLLLKKNKKKLWGTVSCCRILFFFLLSFFIGFLISIVCACVSFFGFWFLVYVSVLLFFFPWLGLTSFHSFLGTLPMTLSFSLFNSLFRHRACKVKVLFDLSLYF